MNKHPTADGRELTGALTLEYVREHFMPKDEALKRIAAKETKLQAANEQMLSMQQQLAEAQSATSQVEELRATLRQRDDLDAFRKAGLAKDDGTYDEGIVDLFRYAYGKHVDSLEEADRPTDRDAGFREWMTAEDGARSHAALGHHLKAAAPAEPPPKESPMHRKPPGRPATPPPTGNAGTVAQQPGKMNAEQLRAYFNSAEYRSMPAEQKQQVIAQYSSQG